MSAATHTPGPWRVNNGGRSRLPHIRAADGSYVMDAAPRGSRARSCVRQEADARLIAAAPELLSALRSLVRACDDEGWPRTAEQMAPLQYARTAIAAATGEAP